MRPAPFRQPRSRLPLRRAPTLMQARLIRRRRTGRPPQRAVRAPPAPPRQAAAGSLSRRRGRLIRRRWLRPGTRPARRRSAQRPAAMGVLMWVTLRLQAPLLRAWVPRAAARYASRARASRQPQSRWPRSRLTERAERTAGAVGPPSR